MKHHSHRTSDRRPTPEGEVVGLRIIGGTLRGRSITYSGDLRTRPMKDRVREAVFNLIGPSVVGMHAIDLFAGTGALGIEAVSRGAVRATLIERHLPTLKLIEQNAASLGINDRVTVQFGDAFSPATHQRFVLGAPWLVFCSPPFEFYTSRLEEMLKLIEHLYQAAPPASRFVVEADESFDFVKLLHADRWNMRPYPPAVVGILAKPDQAK